MDKKVGEDQIVESRDVQDEMQDMLTGLAESVAAESGEDPKVVTADFIGKGTEKTEEVAEEEEPTEEESEEEEEEAEEVVDSEDDTEEDEDADTVPRELYNRLMTQVQDLSSARGVDTADALMGGRQVQPAPAKQEEEKSVQVQVPMLEFPEISQEVYEEMMESPAKFASVLKQVAESTRDAVLRSVTPIAYSAAAERVAAAQMVNDFYDKNPDLKEFRSYVGVVCQEVSASHPEMDDRAILQETAKAVRDRLNLQAAKSRKEATVKKAKPAFARPKGTAGHKGRRRVTVNDEFQAMRNI